MEVSKIVECQYCGREVYLPFKCPYCGGYFCAEHRLPENHACPEIWRAKAPRKEIIERTHQESTYTYPLTYQTQFSRGKAIFFSLTELKHIALGVFLVFMVGLSPYFYNARALDVFIILGLILSASFILHELAHKVAAQIQGLWAEFRIMLFGALLTLLSILAPFFKIISPGAVVIAGYATMEKVGKTALAGPLTNIVIAAFLIPLVKVHLPAYLYLAVVYGAWINSFVAFFNLIPFSVMDGLKILLWDKKVWAVTFVISIVLTIYTGTTIFLKF